MECILFGSRPDNEATPNIIILSENLDWYVYYT